MAQFQSSYTKKEDFLLNNLKSFLFFQVLVEDTSRDEGSSTTTGIQTFRYIPCDFSATPETIPGLKAWVTCFGLQEGMWGWVW